MEEQKENRALAYYRRQGLYMNATDLIEPQRIAAQLKRDAQTLKLRSVKDLLQTNLTQFQKNELIQSWQQQQIGQQVDLNSSRVDERLLNILYGDLNLKRQKAGRPVITEDQLKEIIKREEIKRGVIVGDFLLKYKDAQGIQKEKILEELDQTFVVQKQGGNLIEEQIGSSEDLLGPKFLERYNNLGTNLANQAPVFIPLGVQQRSREEQKNMQQRQLADFVGGMQNRQDYSSFEPQPQQSAAALARQVQKMRIRNPFPVQDDPTVENQVPVSEYRDSAQDLSLQWDNVLDDSVMIDSVVANASQQYNLTSMQQSLLNSVIQDRGNFLQNFDYVSQQIPKKDKNLGPDYDKLVDAFVKRIGPDVVLFTKAVKGQKQVGNNVAAPAMNDLIQKKNQVTTSMFLRGIYKMAEDISKLSGVIDSTRLWLYKTKPEDLFSTHVVQKETTVFKPSPGLAFKVRQLLC